MYRNQNVFTFEKCCEILNTSKNVEVVQIFHEKLFDLGSLLDNLYSISDHKTVNIKLTHIGYRQKFHGEEESEQDYKKDNAYKNSQSKIII